ncbi:MAG: hypothetical protein LBR72_02715 [Oscillospiraceae bacterium]|jgi:hypothetical protein|nr:hypothetical protein [Oscillospiraceae bacterium]
MKIMKTLRRGAALFLCAVLVLTLGACGFQSRLEGFINASLYMVGEQNPANHSQLIIKTSDDAEYMSFEAFMGAVMMAGMTEDFSFVENKKIGLDIVSKAYDGNAEIKLGWIGEDSEIEPLVSFIVDGTDLYIGTEILDLAGPYLSLAMPSLLALGEYDYIKIAGSDDPLYGSFAPPEDTDVAALLTGLSEKLSGAFKENAAAVLTEDFDKTLTEKGGVYTLSLNTESFINLLTSVLELVAGNGEEVAGTLKQFVTALGMPDAAITGADVIQYAEEALTAAKVLDIAELPNFELMFSVKAEGKDEQKKHSVEMVFRAPEETMNKFREMVPPVTEEGSGIVLPKMVDISVTSVNTVQTEEIGLPEGSSVIDMADAEELIMDGFGSLPTAG